MKYYDLIDVLIAWGVNENTAFNIADELKARGLYLETDETE